MSESGARFPKCPERRNARVRESARTDGGAGDTGAVTSVRIVHLSAEALRALADGDLAAAQSLAPVPLSPWLVSADERSVWERRATQVVQTPADLEWVTGVIFDDAIGRAVGAGGFHAAPDDDGMVEAGYSVDPDFRRRGYARATLRTLIERARAEPAVTRLPGDDFARERAVAGAGAAVPFRQGR